MIIKLLVFISKILTLPFWYVQKYLPRNKKIWLFGAGSGMLYFDNAKWLFEYVLTNEKHINAVWITRSRDVYKKLKSEKKPVYLTNSIKGIYYSLRAGLIFINNHPKDLNCRAINGAMQFWLWHGLMMKQIGEDARLFSMQKNGIKTKLFQLFQEFIYPELSYKPDYVINTSVFFTPFFCSAFNLSPEKVLITGYPRNDGLFLSEKESFIADLDNRFDHPVKVLYLPTWRDSLLNKGLSFNPFDSYNFDILQFSEVLKVTNTVFLFKGHDFQNININSDTLYERFFNLNDHIYSDLYNLIKDVDVLITDYSSIYFDFLLTGKPIILAPFDYENYTTQSRPLYYDYSKEIEGVKASNWSEVFEIIRNKSYYKPSIETVQKFHKYNDNLSCKRVTEKVFQLV